MIFPFLQGLRRIAELPLRFVAVLYRGMVALLGARVVKWLSLAAIVGAAWTSFAALAAYVWAPIAGSLGQAYWSREFDYFDQRSRGIRIIDAKGLNVGIFSPQLEPDYLAGTKPVQLADYTAYPDHKTLPVDTVPEPFWACLHYHEDRFLGTWRNPFGIDFVSTLRMPVTMRGGSTLSMQLARMYKSTLPSARESLTGKVTRKVSEWGLGPVIHWKLTHDSDPDRFKRWAANHLPMIQRHGGGNLYGIGLASEILFGRSAEELAADTSPLSTAQQYILAAAVNQPVGLLKSEDTRVETVRLKAWRRIAGSRAQECRKALLSSNPDVAKRVGDILAKLADEPPQPRMTVDPAKPPAGGDAAVDELLAANPVRRAIDLAWDVEHGASAELRERYGPAWRDTVSEVRLTLDIAANERLRQRLMGELERLQRELSAKISPSFTLVASKTEPPLAMPDVVIAAQDAEGHIVRYFEMSERASYFGSAFARNAKTGLYDSAKEARATASAAKLLAAIAIANRGLDTPVTPYATARPCGWPCGGKEGNCSATAHRAFSRSLNAPIMARLVHLGLEGEIAELAARAGFNRPDPVTPFTTASVCGYLGASPRSVNRLSGLILAALTGRGSSPLPPPSLLKEVRLVSGAAPLVEPSTLSASQLPIAARGTPFLRSVLSGPLCERAGKAQSFTGTLARLGKPGLDPRGWCAANNPAVALHFGKTGSFAANGTIDLWATGGIQFKNGQSYSYVALVGTGSVNEPWAHDLGAGYVTAPLVNALLEDLAPAQSVPEVRPSSATADVPAEPRRRAKPGPKLGHR